MYFISQYILKKVGKAYVICHVIVKLISVVVLFELFKRCKVNIVIVHSFWKKIYGLDCE